MKLLISLIVFLTFSTLAANGQTLADFNGRQVILAVPEDFGTKGTSPETGEPYDWEIEATEAIAKRLNLKFKYDRVNWPTAIAALKEGKREAAFAPIIFGATPYENLRYTAPLMNFGIFYVVGASEAAILSKADIVRNKAASIGILDGNDLIDQTLTYTLFDGKKFSQTVKRYNTLRALFEALTAGEVDVVMTYGSERQAYVEGDPAAFKILSEIRSPADLGFLVQLKSELLPAISTAIYQMENDGTLAAIRTKWLRGTNMIGRAEQEANLSRIQQGLKQLQSGSGSETASQKQDQVSAAATSKSNKGAENSQGDKPDCAAAYEAMKSDPEVVGDLGLCSQPLSFPELKECKLPEKFDGERPASHVVLALDASGSMAGKLGGKTKMSIAKREALDFLNSMPNQMKVGLIVYGHKGNNTEAGKVKSCASYEWADKPGLNRTAMKKSIAGLAPTGWTPLANVIEFAGEELAKVANNGKGDVAVPVMYLLSDGKETCDGDPVAAASALNASGVKIAINVIGFDVDEETRVELEAISKAGGGKYFAAKTAKALRDHLRAAAEYEGAMARYNYCRLLNVGKVAMVAHNARIASVSCYTREHKKKRFDILRKKLRAIKNSEDPLRACHDDMFVMMANEDARQGLWLSQESQRIEALTVTEFEKMDAGAVFKGLPRK